MYKPTHDRRSVLLALRITEDDNVTASPQTGTSRRVAGISALFADPDTTTVERFDGDEAALLDSFWRSMRRNDRVFAADVANGLSLLRERSWQLGVIPGPGIDLNTLYDLEEIDTTAMWGTVDGPRRPRLNPEAMRKPRSTFQLEYNTEVIVHSRD